MINVLDLYIEDVGQPRRAGSEYQGPCPVCSPDDPNSDRFCIFPEQNNGHGSYHCGHGKGGNGCGIGGDNIQYLRDVRQMSYPEACGHLGIEAKGGDDTYQYSTPSLPRQSRKQNFTPVDRSYPEEVIDPELWCKKGMEFVDKCHQTLLGRKMTIAYLMSRGITMTSIKKYKLGFHAGEERAGKPYQLAFRPWPSWGLRDERKPESNKYRCIKLVAGLVIPYIVDGNLHRITIRLVKPGPKDPKYDYVRGSIRDLWMSNPSARAHVVIEAELDCIAVDEAVGDLIGTVGLGGSGVRPEVGADEHLKKSACILGSQDFDEAGFKSHAFWVENYPNYKLWPVPDGKDPGEAFQKGIDLRDWALGGLPPGLLSTLVPAESQQENTTEHRPKGLEGKEEKKEQHHSSVSNLQELHDLLVEAEGLFKIYDDGNGMGQDLSEEWSHRYPDKARRVTELLYSDELSSYIATLGDGVYGPEHIREALVYG